MVYCHHANLSYAHPNKSGSTVDESQVGIKFAGKNIIPGAISTTPDMQMIPL